MSFTYVIPDIHGRYDLMLDALERIQQRERDAKIVFLGDYVDRGPDSREVVLMLMNAKPNWVCLKGNHEDMMVAAVRNYVPMSHWVRNGGGETLASFSGHDGPTQRRVVQWADALPLYHEDKHRVYVHAGVPLDTDNGAYVPLDEQSADELLWHRYPEGIDHGWRDKHVVHGHSICRDGPLMLVYRTNLDCGAVFTGRLVVGVFDDDVPGGPVEILG